MENVNFIYHNAEILSRYDLLSQEGKKPILEVYRDTRLVIVKHDTTNIFDTLIVKVKSVIYSILRSLGLIQNSQTRIQELREDVNRYHFAWAQQNTIGNTHQLLRTETEIRHSIEELTSNRAAIETDLAIARQAIAAKDAALQSLHTTQAKITQLEIRLEQIPNLESRCHRLESDIEARKQALRKINADIAQNDYKAKVTELEYTVSNLSSECSNLRSEIANMSYCSYYHCPDPSAH